MSDDLFVCPLPEEAEAGMIRDLVRMGFQGSLSLNDIAKIDPVVEAAIHPVPQWWDQMTHLPEDEEDVDA